MEQETIILDDGSRKDVSGERITEYDGSVFVWEEWPDSIAEALTNAAYEEYEGARLA